MFTRIWHLKITLLHSAVRETAEDGPPGCRDTGEQGREQNENALKPFVVKAMSPESTNHCAVYLNTPGILFHTFGSYLPLVMIHVG